MKNFKSKFEKLYSLVMESLIGSIKPSDEEKNEFNTEVLNFFNKLIEILKSDPEVNFNKNSELIELSEKENKKIIKCPNRIRSIIMNNNVFLTKHITDLLNESNILKDYDFKISKVSNKKEDYSNVKTSANEIKFVKKGDSSAGGYDIPVVIQSNDDPEDFYTFSLRLIAKPNTGKVGKRDGNVSVTICEFIPVMLWNTNASTDIDVDSIVDLIKTFAIKDDSITGKPISEGSSSYKKLVQFKDYFINKYDTDPEKSIIINKIYGAIGVYSYLRKFGDKYEYKGICIWTDITSLKPDGLKNSPADIMISRSSSSNDWLQVSLKSGGAKEEDPPLANPTIKSFFEFVNLNGGNYEIKNDIFNAVLNEAKDKGKWFTSDEIDKLRSYEKSPKLLVNYLNNNFEDMLKASGKGTVRQYIIDKLYDIIIKEFSDDYQKLIDYILQVNNSDNFIILKAIEKSSVSMPEVVDINVILDDDIEINKTNTGIVFSNFMINGKHKKIEMAVRTKGHGIHAYFSYDLVVKLLNDTSRESDEV